MENGFKQEEAESREAREQSPRSALLRDTELSNLDRGSRGREVKTVVVTQKRPWQMSANNVCSMIKAMVNV